MKRVLVLCTGNSCRSQMAEGYLNFFAQDSAEVFSAGLEDQAVNPYAVRVMAEDNIDISLQSSKTFSRFAGQHFDYLITVCDEAGKHSLQNISYGKKLHYSIPDPAVFEGGEEEKMEEFRRIRELVKKNILKFIGGALYKSAEAAA